ncbi:guanylyl cyclase, partial [Reticulomyxa filosa]
GNGNGNGNGNEEDDSNSCVYSAYKSRVELHHYLGFFCNGVVSEIPLVEEQYTELLIVNPTVSLYQRILKGPHRILPTHKFQPLWRQSSVHHSTREQELIEKMLECHIDMLSQINEMKHKYHKRALHLQDQNFDKTLKVKNTSKTLTSPNTVSGSVPIWKGSSSSSSSSSSNVTVTSGPSSLSNSTSSILLQSLVQPSPSKKITKKKMKEKKEKDKDKEKEKDKDKDMIKTDKTHYIDNNNRTSALTNNSFPGYVSANTNLGAFPIATDGFNVLPFTVLLFHFYFILFYFIWLFKKTNANDNPNPNPAFMNNSPWINKQLAHSNPTISSSSQSQVQHSIKKKNLLL